MMDTNAALGLLRELPCKFGAVFVIKARKCDSHFHTYAIIVYYIISVLPISLGICICEVDVVGQWIGIHDYLREH